MIKLSSTGNQLLALAVRSARNGHVNKAARRGAVIKDLGFGTSPPYTDCGFLQAADIPYTEEVALGDTIFVQGHPYKIIDSTHNPDGFIVESQ